MKREQIDLHGLNLNEAITKVNQNIDWAVNHNVELLVINHGKGHHSERNFSVLKTEIRKMLKENTDLQENGYRVIWGESNFPVALGYDEGQTLIVARGKEGELVGGRAEQNRNQRIFSDEVRQERKARKKMRAEKRSR